MSGDVLDPEVVIYFAVFNRVIIGSAIFGNRQTLDLRPVALDAKQQVLNSLRRDWPTHVGGWFWNLATGSLRERVRSAVHGCLVGWARGADKRVAVVVDA